MDLKGKTRADGPSPTTHCGLCHQPLLIPQASLPAGERFSSSDDEDDDIPSHMIDDVELLCGDHFHWDCLIQVSKLTPAEGLRSCPTCRKDVLTMTEEGEKLLVQVRNEGGVTTNYDLGEEILSELALDSNPHLRRNQAFLTLMAQGDLEAAESFLRGDDSTDGLGPIDPNVTYEEGGLTALHVAAFSDK